jgi:hypothetical protein
MRSAGLAEPKGGWQNWGWPSFDDAVSQVGGELGFHHLGSL